MRWSAMSSATWSPRVTSSREDLERLRAGAGAQDAVALAELAAQVAGDGGEDRGLVVDGEDRGTAGAFRGWGRGLRRHLAGSFSCPSTPTRRAGAEGARSGADGVAGRGRRRPGEG